MSDPEIDELIEDRVCKLDGNLKLDMKKVNKYGNLTFKNGAIMRCLECIFELVLKESKVNDKITDKINKYLVNTRDPKESGANGMVVFSEIITDKFKVAIKTPKKPDTGDEADNLRREYIVALLGTNRLRYIVPNFSCVLGGFSCSKMSEKAKLCLANKDSAPYVCYEFISGKSLHDVRRQLSTEEILYIYMMLLLAFEVAQRECRFCHYDIHSSNIICKKAPQEFTYSVALDNKTYKVHIKKGQYYPIIIDYGMSTVTYKNVVIGTQDYYHVNRFDVLLPGWDMYWLLLRIIDDKPKLYELSKFFKDDPYDIKKQQREGVLQAKEDYGKEIAFSGVAKDTPQMFLDWIFDSFEINSSKISREDRSTVLTQDFLEIEPKFYFNEFLGIKNKPEPFVHNINSYLQAVYVLKKMQDSDNPYFDEQKKELKEKIENNRESLNQADENFMQDVPVLPNPMAYVDKILQLEIENNPEEMDDTINEFLKDILPMYLKYHDLLNLYYIITELNLQKVYVSFISKMKTQMPVFDKHISHVHQAKRWLLSIQQYYTKNNTSF